MDQENSAQGGPVREAVGRGGGRRRRRSRWPWVVGGLVALGLLGLLALAVVLAVVVGAAGGGSVASAPTFDEEYVSGGGPAKVAVVPIEGVISSSDTTSGGLQSAAIPEGLADALRQAREDASVKAVVLEVNSPGGGTTASDEMHQNILDFEKNSGKPVVVSMGDTAASGGYFISTAADKIVANPTTLTGSLGVIIEFNNFQKIADKYGYKQEIIKSGPYKDMGNAFRDLTPKERGIFQGIVNESYDEFLRVISTGRHIPESRVREIADGRVYSGEQAKKLGLVDSFGDLGDAARVAGGLAKTRRATVVRYTQPQTLTDTLLSGLAPQQTETQRLIDESGINLEPRPYYLYLPGT